MYEATRWGRRGATINSISPGIIITPLANDEQLTSAFGQRANLILPTPSTLLETAIHKDAQEGASNELLEPVTDDVYNKLK